MEKSEKFSFPFSTKSKQNDPRKWFICGEINKKKSSMLFISRTSHWIQNTFNLHRKESSRKILIDIYVWEWNDDVNDDLEK